MILNIIASTILALPFNINVWEVLDDGEHYATYSKLVNNKLLYNDKKGNEILVINTNTIIVNPNFITVTHQNEISHWSIVVNNTVYTIVND